jgi:GGDEF domain-containing protein
MPPRGIAIQKILAQHGITLIAKAREREWVFRAFDDLVEFPASLAKVLRLASAYSLRLKIYSQVELPPETLEMVLRFAVDRAELYGEELTDIRVKLNGTGKIVVEPWTWKAEEVMERENIHSRLSVEAQSMLNHALEGVNKSEEAEKRTAGVLFRNFRAREVRVYDVDRSGGVVASHAFVKEGEQARKIKGSKLDSHFRERRHPHEYINEVMGDVVLTPGIKYQLISDPQQDERCWITGADGQRRFIESRPFALIAEEVDGEIARVYKVDWENVSDLMFFAEVSIETVFETLARFKQTLALEEEKKFLREITEIALKKDDTKEALKIISGKIAEFFKRNGAGYNADRVTIMLKDRLTDSLLTQVIWTPGGIQEVEWYSGPGNMGIGRRIYELGETVSLSRVSEWKEGAVAWGRGGEGSLLGTVVRGENGEDKVGTIVVSSKEEDSFSQAEVRFLERVSEIVGPAFERIARKMEDDYLDDKFGRPAPRVLVFNDRYLTAKLNAAINLIKGRGGDLSLIYFDIDDFKHLNEAWLHKEVDPVLREIFIRTATALREGEICRQGGEEIAIILRLPLRIAKIVAERIRVMVGAEPIVREIFYTNEKEAGAMQKKIEEGRKKWPKSGILDVKLATKEGIREGETKLVVTVRKTVSIGVAEYREGDTPLSLLNRADLRMQRAKRLGKDQAVSSEE